MHVTLCTSPYAHHLAPNCCRPPQILLDPYAKFVKGRAVFGQRDDFEQFKTKASSWWSSCAGCRVDAEVAHWWNQLLVQLQNAVACCLNRRSSQERAVAAAGPPAPACLLSPSRLFPTPHTRHPAGGQRVPGHLRL